MRCYICDYESDLKTQSVYYDSLYLPNHHRRTFRKEGNDYVCSHCSYSGREAARQKEWDDPEGAAGWFVDPDWDQ